MSIVQFLPHGTHLFFVFLRKAFHDAINVLVPAVNCAAFFKQSDLLFLLQYLEFSYIQLVLCLKTRK